MEDKVVHLQGVTKKYRGHTAVDAFDMQVGRGSVYGFIGPNGSGKTTTLRMLLRIIEPDEGVIEVLGKTRGRVANDRIAYLPEERGLYPKMKILPQLVYFGQLKGLSRKESKVAAEQWLKKLDLWDWRDKKLEALSKGMSQKIQFITTVMNRPEILVLDEPFSGLDPVNLDILRNEIFELKRSGTTVLFSTHDMHVAEQMCDHISMIYKGRRVLDGSMQQIQSKYGEDTIRLRVGNCPSLDPAAWEGVDSVKQLGREWEIQTKVDPQDILRTAMTFGPIERFEIVHPSLHDIFVRIARPQKEDMQDQPKDLEGATRE